MEVDGAGDLGTVEVHSRISSEDHRLVGAGDVDLLDDPAVEVKLEEDLVTVGYQIPRQPQDWRRWLGGGLEGWKRCRVWVYFIEFYVVYDGQGDEAADGRSGQDDEGRGEALGYVGCFGHPGRLSTPRPGA